MLFHQLNLVVKTKIIHKVMMKKKKYKTKKKREKNHIKTVRRTYLHGAPHGRRLTKLCAD